MALDPFIVINLDTGEKLEKELAATDLVVAELPKNLIPLSGEENVEVGLWLIEMLILQE